MSPNYVEIVNRPNTHLNLPKLKEIWVFRFFLLNLVLREFRVRYKQTILGFAWAIITPVMTMLAFTFVFNNLAGIDSGKIPYPLFAYAALVPWNLFASGLTYAATSIVTNADFIGRIYFPRLLAPLAKQFSGAADMGVAFVILLFLMLFYGYLPSLNIVFLPFFVLIAMATSYGVGMALSAIHVRYRDIGPAMPFFVQFWLYLTPVAYPSTLLNSDEQLLYSINPMVTVCEGFRWAMLGTAAVPPVNILISICSATLFFIFGLLVFQQMEGSFPDFI